MCVNFEASRFEFSRKYVSTEKRENIQSNFVANVKD